MFHALSDQNFMAKWMALIVEQVFSSYGSLYKVCKGFVFVYFFQKLVDRVGFG